MTVTHSTEGWKESDRPVRVVTGRGERMGRVADRRVCDAHCEFLFCILAGGSCPVDLERPSAPGLCHCT